MSLRPIGAADAVKPNVPRARASAMSLADTGLESTTAPSVSTICAAAAEAHAAAARSHAASPMTKRLGSGLRRGARGSEGLANREIDLDPGVLPDLPERLAPVDADRAARPGVPH